MIFFSRETSSSFGAFFHRPGFLVLIMQASTPKGQFRPAGWVVTGPIGPPDSFRRDAMMALTPTKGSYISFPIPTKKGNPAKNDDFNILVLWSSY